jgi:hypothetical protein
LLTGFSGKNLRNPGSESLLASGLAGLARMAGYITYDTIFGNLKMKKIFSFSLRLNIGIGLGLLINATALAETSKANSEFTQALRLVDAWLDSTQAYQHIPAMSVGVVVGDDLIWAKGYGTIDPKHKVPASSKTIYLNLSPIFPLQTESYLTH